MPSLSDKLKELGVQVGASRITPGKKTISAQNLVDVLDGRWEDTRSGECFTVRKSIPAAGDNKDAVLHVLPVLEVFSHLPNLEGIADVSPESILYIDTETTGLSGGAGTYVFLIGAGRVINGQIEFAQFFLQDPATAVSHDFFIIYNKYPGDVLPVLFHEASLIEIGSTMVKTVPSPTLLSTSIVPWWL